MAVYSNRFVEVMMDSDGKAYPNEKVACHHHQYSSTLLRLLLLVSQVHKI